MARTKFNDARILMVDDQESNLLLLEDILDAGGYGNRRAVSDSRQVVDEFRAFKPDLVLLDLMMPYLDGVAVMEQLHSLIPVDEYLPILVLTADVTRETRRRVLAAGAKDFLTKPLDEDEVLLRVRNQLDTRFLYLQQMRQAQQQIDRLTTLLRELTENLPTVLWMSSGDARDVLYVNCACEKLWKCSPQTLYQNGQAWLEAVHPEDRPHVRSRLQELVQGKKATMHYRVQLPAGSTHFVRSTGFPICDHAGRVLRIVGYAEDATEARNLELQLQQSQKLEAFGQLAGGVAHDFNNLLTVINGFSEMLLSGMCPADRQQDLAREIRKAGERAAALTRQLLAFSRKQILQPVVLDLNVLVRESEKMLRRLIGEDIDMATALAPDLGQVKADPGQLEQVIMNLVVNARDAMPTGGKLTIETRNVELDQSYVARHPEVQPGNYVLLAISDTGIGMDAATQAKIFEPFFTTKEAGKGTGLGLAVVHGIIKQSGGSIELYSEFGHGSTFKIYLPRVEHAAVSTKSSPGLSRLPRGSETILLADDEDMVRETARLILESVGYTVLPAKGGDDALLICQQHQGPIHLLLTDVVMPRLSGRQVAEQARALRRNLKVLFMSGYTADAIVRHGILENGVAFVQKPLTATTLARKVREILEEK